jgi:hypothetical protein
MLFWRKKEQIDLDQRIVWGLWVPRRLQMGYKFLASDLGVPISVLAQHVLLLWYAQNAEKLLNDEQSKQEFAEYLVEKYVGQKQD